MDIHSESPPPSDVVAFFEDLIVNDLALEIIDHIDDDTIAIWVEAEDTREITSVVFAMPIPEEMGNGHEVHWASTRRYRGMIKEAEALLDWMANDPDFHFIGMNTMGHKEMSGSEKLVKRLGFTEVLGEGDTHPSWVYNCL